MWLKNDISTFSFSSLKTMLDFKMFFLTLKLFFFISKNN